MKSGDEIGGRYRLRAELGRGGMSVVWRADDEVLGRPVAVKVLSAALAGDPELRQRIRAEARAAAGMRHAGIVAVFDYGEFSDGGRTLSYVVMELVDGRPLDDMLADGPLPWRLAVLVGAQAAAALAAAHRDGIVHRDVKPANVMVTATGVKLVDFGISAAVGALDGRDGQVLGTPAYLAPERIEGGPVRPATDVYALGLLLHRAMAGQMPWDASSVTQMLKAHIHLDPEPLPRTPDRPAEVARLVSRCLAKKPGDRPSAAEVADVLGEIAGLPPANLLRTAAQPTVVLRRPRGRRPRPSLLAAAAAAAVLALGGSWWVAGEASTSPPADAAAPGNQVVPSSPAPTVTSVPRTAVLTTKAEAKTKVTAQQVVSHRAPARRPAPAARPVADHQVKPHPPAGGPKPKTKAKVKPPKPRG